MPWRRPPRAALLFLLGAGALTAAAAALRPDPDIPRASINSTLTRDAEGCAGVTSVVWHPLSGLDYTGRLRIRLPAQFGGAMVLFVGDAAPLDFEASTERGEPVAINHERLVVGPGVGVPPDFWIEDGSPLSAPPFVSRLTIDAAGESDRSISLGLGRRAPRVLARLIGYPATARAPVCAEAIARDEIYFGTGWYGQEHTSDHGAVRWMREHGAVLVTSPHGRGTTLRFRAAPAELEGTELIVRVNDVHDLATIPLHAGFRDYALVVPDAAWAAGTNELFFTVSRTRKVGTRVRGLALASLHVE
jgi:hypothetical protein